MQTPLSEKQHQVIFTLCQFVKKNGPRVLDDVTVKQAENPMFGFLKEGDLLHPYFEFLKAGVLSDELRPSPELRFFEEIPKLNSGALSALLGSDEGLNFLFLCYFPAHVPLIFSHSGSEANHRRIL
jgi:hypothetical protein